MFRKTKGYNIESIHFTYGVFPIVPGVDNVIQEVENI